MKKLIGCLIPFLAVCLLLGVLFLYAQSAQHALAASTRSNPEAAIIVNTLEDELNSDGDCSLREAITAANTNAASDGCPAGVAVLTDTITFSMHGVITVASQLSVTAGGPLEIDGGDVITTSGGDTTRVWWVETGSDLTLKHLVIVKGESSQGGGLYNNYGNVTVISGTFYKNQATEGGGIYNLGTINIIDSSFRENNAHNLNGGMRNYGTMTISNTDFTQNTAIASSGAIGNSGIMTLSNTNFTQNSSIYSNGAVGNSGTMSVINCTFTNNAGGGGGGGLGSGGTLLVTHSTFSGNTGGGILAGGDATIIDSTITGNNAPWGGGILSGAWGIGNVSIENTTISGNSASQRGGGLYIWGPTVVTNSTISGNTSGSFGGGVFINETDVEYSFNIVYSTISGNSAPSGGGIFGTGIYGNASGALSNTIVANNPSGNDCTVNVATLTDGVTILILTVLAALIQPKAHCRIQTQCWGHYRTTVDLPSPKHYYRIARPLMLEIMITVHRLTNAA